MGLVGDADGIPAPWFPTLDMHQKHLGDLLRHGLLGPPVFLIHLGWGWGLTRCIFNHLPGDTNTAGLGPRGELLLWLGQQLLGTENPLRIQGDIPQ